MGFIEITAKALQLSERKICCKKFAYMVYYFKIKSAAACRLKTRRKRCTKTTAKRLYAQFYQNGNQSVLFETA